MKVNENVMNDKNPPKNKKGKINPNHEVITVIPEDSVQVLSGIPSIDFDDLAIPSKNVFEPAMLDLQASAARISTEVFSTMERMNPFLDSIIAFQDTALDLKRICNQNASIISSMASFSSVRNPLTASIADYQHTAQATIASLTEPMSALTEMAKPLLESVPVLKNVSLDLMRFENLEEISGISFKIPNINSSYFQNKIELYDLSDIANILSSSPMWEQVKQYSDSVIDIDCVEPGLRVNEHKLTAVLKQTVQLGIVQFQKTQELSIKVDKVEVKVETVQEELTEMKQFMIEDSKHKDKMLEELFGYFRQGQSSKKFELIKFDSKASELWLDDNKISIQRDTNQNRFCNVLFKNKARIGKIWEVADIIEAMGERTDDKHDLTVGIALVYNTIRHLNEKIQKETGIEECILYESKTVMVNPKYL